MISIIIPVYDAEKTILKCVDSIISQTYHDWEIILVNDGSKDKSENICRCLCEKDARIKHVYKDNGGVSSARNKGLEIAKGEWIAFCDSDDWVNNDYLENLAKYTEYDYVISGIIRHPKAHHTFIHDKSFVNEGIKDYLTYSYLWNGSPCAKLFKRSIITENNIRFDEKLKSYEDTAFCLHYIYYCNSIRLIPYAGYNYDEPVTKCIPDKYPITFEQVKYYYDAINKPLEKLCSKWQCKKPIMECSFLAHCGYSQILEKQSDEEFYNTYMAIYPEPSKDKFYNTPYLSPVYYCVNQVLKEYKYKEYRKAIKHAKALVNLYGDKLDNVNLRKSKDRLYLRLIKNKMFKLVIVAAAILDCNKH